VDADVLVRDYLDRLEAAAVALPANRREELTAEVREHINAALADAGRSDEVTVRNILERLGSPEEIVAAETDPAGTRGGAAVALVDGAGETGPRWSAVEVSAVVLLCLAWPASFLPFGPVLWVAIGLIGLILVWASHIWSTRRKVTGTTCVVALYLLVGLLTTPVTAQCTTGNPPHPCPTGGPSPVVTGS
jgi:HAAS domain-containing protein